MMKLQMPNARRMFGAGLLLGLIDQALPCPFATLLMLLCFADGLYLLTSE